MFAVSGILFNHESPRRGETFVTKKITRAAARISLGLQEKLFLGNLNAKRDWGHAKDYVNAMYLMLQQEVPEDYVIATGAQYSVRDFCDAVFRELGIEIIWQGSGVDEKGIDKKTGKVIIEIAPRYFRPTEVESLLGDPSKAQKNLGWKAEIGFNGLVKEMVATDLEEANRDLHLKNGGFATQSHHE